MDLESGEIRSPRPYVTQTIAIWQPRPDEPRIPRVPDALRRHKLNGDAYYPKVASFGPYHYGRPGLERCEAAKHLTLKMFLEGSPHHLDYYLEQLGTAMVDVRDAYDLYIKIIYSREEVEGMLLVDACFLIYFMGIDPQKSENHRVLKNHLGRLNESLIKQDMYVVDNQIPYKFLKKLINLRYGDRGEEAMSKFLYLLRIEHHMSMWVQDREQRIAETHDYLKVIQPEPVSLFEALYEVVVWDITPKEGPELTNKDDQVEEEEKAAVAAAGKKKSLRSFRSADELRSRGIQFRPSHERSLVGNIKFHSSIFFYGKLELPSWCINKHSRVFLLNMMAYELSPYNHHKSTVLNYINFMKRIIDSAADVRVLRERRILYTILGDDEEVLELYRGLDTYGRAHKASFYKVKEDIQKHYDSKLKTLIVKFFNIYFGTPWAVMGMLAGIVILILTIMQTHYTMFPPKK